ncbi:MAG: molybdopterin-dependent oxidoreductase [Proteobacteria bacterium]|nr:molybdopterin-dependent oxidoreductase [Pseudomonadota bacterium]
MPGVREHVRTTCPRDCYDACGIVAIKRGGAVTKLLGDPDHPVARGALCGKCALAYNGVFRDPKSRLTTPLRRAGPKGEGRFEAIGWDEAMAAIAERLTAIVATSGAETILHTHYTGTCSLIAGNFPERFFNRLGATEVDPDTICNNAGHVALAYILGSSTIGFDPRTAKDAACIVVWGANPSASAPHAHKHWLRESPARVIVVDPVRTATAEAADLHLQPFPGSDAALAFALLHVLRRERLIDRDFIAAHTLGWDEVEATVEACDAAWGEAATGVPAALIERAAQIYGQGPSMLWLGQGLQRQHGGGNIFRACAMLPAVTGNFAKPGAGLYYLNGGAMRGLDGDYLSAPHLRQREAPAISHMDLAAHLEDGEKSRALVSWNMNVAASGPQQERLQRALMRDDLFTVVVELFATDTADYADIVLPAASFMEFDDIVMSYFNLGVSVQAKLEEPMGDALPNQEIFRKLARAMGFEEPELFEPDTAIIEQVLSSLGVAGGFQALAEAGTLAVFEEPLLQFADLSFPTPSGRIEIASARAEAHGLPRVPAPDADARPGGGRLRLLSPASPWLMNDSYANDPKIAEQLGEATVTLHPDDAAARGLTAGDRVTLANRTGSLALTLAISDIVPPGAALSLKGRWPKREGGGVNVNALNPGVKSDMGESSCVHGVEVTVTRA